MNDRLWLVSCFAFLFIKIERARDANPDPLGPLALVGRNRTFRAFVCWVAGSCLYFAPIPSASDPEVSQSGISVRDAIEMTRFVEPSAIVHPWSDNSVAFSPTGTHFAIVTQKGRLDRDTITFEIFVFNVEVVRDFVNGIGPSDASIGRSVVSMELVPLNTDGVQRPVGIRDLRWLSDSTLAFIGQRGTSTAQVYSVDIHTQQLIELTDFDRHIKRFDISAQLDLLIFVAEDDARDPPMRNLRGYAVESGMLFNTLLREPSKSRGSNETYFTLDLRTRKLTQLSDPGHSLARWSDIWLSPNGRWLIALADATDVPKDWLVQYTPFGKVGEINKEHEGNPALHPRRNNIRQYVLIDTATGHFRSLLRAPVSWGRVTVHWSSDSERAILTNTHLPLEDVTAPVLEHRRSTVSVVEIDIETGQHTVIDSYPLGGGGHLQETKKPSEDVLVVQYAKPHHGGTTSLLYRRSQNTGKWESQANGATQETTQQISVFVQQDVNTPPDLAVTDTTTGRTKRITDFNPTLRDKIVQRFEQFEWTDKNGRSWEGGLLYPPDYRVDRRYPLVIQTYGYSLDEFLIDGPGGITSAFAARPLAGQGMIVLQMANSPSSDSFRRTGPDEGPNYIAAYEGAVQALDARGTIDSKRVGLIGFSRTGLHVSYAVAFSNIAFAAATIADSTSHGLTSYMNLFGRQPPGLFGIERAIGAPFWGEGRQIWLEKSPNLNAHRVRTPLRFEAYGIGLNPYWDMYTVLRRHHHPAEMFHIPIAAHNLQRPLARYASQQGNVDWFAFWLTGYEDPDPAKSDQYKRWRKLRQEHTIIETRTTTVKR